jgi:hypothetical protein
MEIDMRIHRISLAICAAIAFATTVSAQDAPLLAPRFRMATYAGASIPTGTLRDAFDNSFLLGANATYDLRSHLALLGSFDWTNPATTFSTNDTHANVYQANLGLELGGARSAMKRWALVPFADLGGGLRHYDFRSDGVSNRTRGVGFASLGTEVAVGRTALSRRAPDDSGLDRLAPVRLLMSDDPVVGPPRLIAAETRRPER